MQEVMFHETAVFCIRLRLGRAVLAKPREVSRDEYTAKLKLQNQFSFCAARCVRKTNFLSTTGWQDLLFRRAKVTVTAISFFLHCFPMSQPPCEAPDRTPQKTATKVCAKPIFSALQDGKTFCFAVAVATGTAISFFALFSHGPAIR